MSLPAALPVGTVIGGHYIVGDLINSGGFGAVYRGVDTSEGHRPCAIKETYDVTPAARRQALMEAGVLFSVRSKHLPTLYDALEVNGRFYLIMQLIEGQNLLQLLRTRIGNARLGEQEPNQRAVGPCSEQEVLNWLLPVINVLQELHSRNPPVLHRDIKAANIIVTPDQRAVLVDFGLTKFYDPAVNTMTLAKAVSEGYSPLEQYLGKTSPQSDIYAMAATMYLLLTNRMPPPAIARSTHDTLLAPRLLNPALSPKIERVLLKALMLNADQRYQSMRDFAQALQGPNFNAYADQTLAATPARPAAPTYSAPTQRAAVPSDPYQQQAGIYHPPLPAYNTYPHLPASPLSPATPSVPPGYVMVPQAALQSHQPLPSSFGQGCLWGLVQGIVCALLVYLLKKEADFYLAIVVGWGFYLLAGMRTTRKGGRAARGGWAGYWTGIIGTLVFWLALGISLLVGQTQRVQTIVSNNPAIDPAQANAIAWRQVQPLWPHASASSNQPAWVGLAILVVGGLLLAWLFGWWGGLLGKAQYVAKVTQRKQQRPIP